jgi:hypothetical protein
MAGFARWLRDVKKLSQSDKSAAVCATPPHLEGALISRLSKNKLCDDFEHIETKIKDENEIHKIIENTIDSDVQEKYVDVETAVQDIYVDKQDGLEDDLYDEELDVPSEDDLPISQSKVNNLLGCKFGPNINLIISVH